MIPKKIHYVWVGDKPKPELVLKCIASWKKYLPDYEIIEWGNNSIDMIDNKYIREALVHKKWAFVSDVIRLYALYNHGGIYLDTDVVVNDSLNSFLTNKFFTGHESYKGSCSPAVTAVLGAEKHSKIIKEILRIYDSTSLIKEGKLNLQPNTVIFTKYFEETFNISAPYNEENTLTLEDGCIIYPSHYFCTPKSNLPNYTTHLFNGSWLSPFSRKNKLSLWGFTLSRFKRKANNIKSSLEVEQNEKIIFSIKISKNKTYALIKTTKK